MKNILKDSNAPPRTRGTPVVLVISTKEKSVTSGADDNRFLSVSRRIGMTTPTWTATARGKPVVAKQQPVAGVPVISTIRHVTERKSSCLMEQISLRWQGSRCGSAFRSTGRNGPPGSFETTSGVPAWLARGTPVELSAFAEPDNVRGKDNGELEMVAKELSCLFNADRSEDAVRLNADRACPGWGSLTLSGWGDADLSGPYSRGMPGKVGRPDLDCYRGENRSRGKPPNARDHWPVAMGKSPDAGTNYDVFHRVKLRGMGVVCDVVSVRRT